jgi:hypothetical protein
MKARKSGYAILHLPLKTPVKGYLPAFKDSYFITSLALKNLSFCQVSNNHTLGRQSLTVQVIDQFFQKCPLLSGW